MAEVTDKFKILVISSEADLDLVKFDLQLFAAEDEGRTEDPTEKRIREAREKGQVAKSEELPQNAVMIVGVLTVFFMGGWIYDKVARITVYYLDNFGSFTLTEKTMYIEGARVLETLAAVLLPIFLMTIIAALISNIMQVGFQISTHPLNFDLSKIKFNPAEMIKKTLLSKRVGFNLFKSIIKIVIIGLCSYLIILNEFDTVLSTPDISIAASLKDVLFIAFKILIWSLVLLIVMAIPDYLFQKREFIESIKMSKQDIKQEMKETVGDPHVKARLKEMQRQILTRSMIKNVPKADVVVTNPTHFAVALKWDREKNNSAPAVVAKGVDYIALKIREIAKGNDVMIIENRPLAQEMYKRLEVGDIIPADLYSAVVELYRILYENGKLKDAM